MECAHSTKNSKPIIAFRSDVAIDDEMRLLCTLIGSGAESGLILVRKQVSSWVNYVLELKLKGRENL